MPIDKSDEDSKEKLKSNKALLKKVSDYIESEKFDKSQSLESFYEAILKDLTINKDDYQDALRMSDRGKQVVLKRKPNECFINNYNKRFIGAWQANMDIQFCTDAYAVCTYVCDYWSKDDTGMTAYLKKSFQEAKSWENKDLLSHLKRTYMSKRQVGKCEAIYRAIPSMHLQDSNIGCQFVQSGYTKNHSKFLRKIVRVEDPKIQSNESESEAENDASDNDDEVQENESSSSKVFRVPGREGMFMETESVHDKYASRPVGVKNLTLSQFATSYTKCKKKPKNVKFNQSNVTDETGFIIDHLTEQCLPQHIKMSAGDVYRLRRFSSILRIHSSSKKNGVEEFFAELQLFSPWSTEDLNRWDDDETCLKEYQNRKHIIDIVREKTFPFAMNAMLDEMKAQEELNRLSDEIGERLDGQGAQDDLDVLEQGFEEMPRPSTDFSEWHDDKNFGEHNSKSESNKFRTIELQNKDELLAVTKTLVSEQRVVLQKVLDLVKTSVQCSKSGLARDAPLKMAVILHGGGGVGKSKTTTVCAQWAELNIEASWRQSYQAKSIADVSYRNGCECY